jgi:predicted outer membrane protein
MSISRTTAAAAALGMSLVGVPALAGTLSPADEAFLRNEAGAANAKAAYGELAEQNGSTPQAQELGINMRKDARSDLADLESVAASVGVTLSNQVAPQDVQSLWNLSQLRGQDFDEQLATHIQAQERTELGQLQQEEQAGSNPDLRSYAKDHLREARSILGEARFTLITAQPYDDHGAGKSWYER